MTEPADGFRLSAGELTLEGRSRAGNETWVRVRELGIALDVGRGPDVLIGTSRIFVSHVHPDHFAGIPFLASQRALQNLDPLTVWLPEESHELAAELMAIHERLEQYGYPITLVGASPGQTFPLRRNLAARAHRAPHRVPAVAWELVESRTKLRSEFRHLPGEVVAEMRASRDDMFEELEVSRLFYSGDADAGIFASAPALFGSAVTMLECTYVRPEDRERAAQWGHLHVDEIFEHAEEFRSEAVVLFHFSLRDRVDEIHRRISDRCPASLRGRLKLALPAPFDRVE